MEPKTRKLTDHFGFEIQDIDLAAPLTDESFAAIDDAFNPHSLLLFRGQDLTPAQHVAFSSRWGELEHHVLQQFTLPDNTYMPRPSLGSFLYALEVPPHGGDTWFTSLPTAYDRLPEDLKARIENLKAMHSYQYVYALKYPGREPLSKERKASVPDLVHPVGPVHPVSGRKVLYVSEYIIKRFVGMSPEESQALLDELNARATSDDLVYRHQWRVGDLIFWDNRATMHFAQPYDDVNHTRLMHTTRVVTDVFVGERAA